ncbi:MAG TPA: hypothetical protein VNB49_13595 [Candidatus Dormibacteraeota bacterium]|nr:hypothetical protein [Candidatus Dormibacteraeota bacterium]
MDRARNIHETRETKIMFLNLVSFFRRPNRREAAAAVLTLVPLLALPIFPFVARASAAAASQGLTQNGKRVPLGSLSSTGEVYVNDKPVPVETTVFAGDTIRTGQNSTSIFTMTGNGTLKIAPQTQVVIPGDPQFAAELQSGTVVIDSISGPSGVKVRAGNFVVVPAVRSRVTAAKIEGQSGGSFLVTCLDGDISTIPLQGGSGQLLEAGQSVYISPRGELAAQKQSVAKSSGSSHGVMAGKTTWTLLGLAGAGAGGAAAALGHGGGKQPVSPSGP